jgi:hypothetical protein
MNDLILSAAADRSCHRQWRHFIEALAAVMPGTVGDETSLTILGQVGRSIARSQPLPPCGSLPDLQRAINGCLDAMDWGQAILREDGRHLEITLAGYPHLRTLEGQAVFAATAEAMLEEWLTSQASRRDLIVRLKAAGSGAYPPLIFHYERADGG